MDEAQLLGDRSVEDLSMCSVQATVQSQRFFETLVNRAGIRVGFVSGRTVITSLRVPASCLEAVFVDCEIAGGEVCEDNRWLILSSTKADKGCMGYISLSALCVSCWQPTHRLC